MNKCAITLPREEEKFLEFKNFKNQLFNPYLIDYDFECILKKTHTETAYQEHIIFCVGIYVNHWDKEKSYLKQFYGENVVEQFMQELENIANVVEEVR